MSKYFVYRSTKNIALKLIDVFSASETEIKQRITDAYLSDDEEGDHYFLVRAIDGMVVTGWCVETVKTLRRVP